MKRHTHHQLMWMFIVYLLTVYFYKYLLLFYALQVDAIVMC